MKKAISYIVFGMALLIAACKKDPVVVAVTGSTKNLRIPANFEFKTTAD